MLSLDNKFLNESLKFFYKVQDDINKCIYAKVNKRKTEIRITVQIINICLSFNISNAKKYIVIRTKINE